MLEFSFINFKCFLHLRAEKFLPILSCIFYCFSYLYKAFTGGTLLNFISYILNLAFEQIIAS